MLAALRYLRDHLFLQVIIAIFLGVIVGLLFPIFASDLRFMAIIFIRFIKMVIAPIVFISIVLGINSHKQSKSIGILAFRTLVYFEIMSVVAILLTIGFMMLFKPGLGFDLSAFQGSIAGFKPNVPPTEGLQDFIIHMVPENVVAVLAGDNILTVIILAVVFAISILHVKNNEKILDFFAQGNQIFFRMIGFISKFSPFAAFGAIAATIGHDGPRAMLLLLHFIGILLLSMLVFWIILYAVGHLFGFSVLKLMKHIKEELFIAFGTSSSESVFPQLMQKLESFGCSKEVVGFVLPTGYAFNLDGTAMYVAAGVFFIQQAYHVPLTPMQVVSIILTILIVSKGAAGVAGAGFVTLSAVLAAIPNHIIPLEGLALLLGIDRVMSDTRTITNIIGNTVGTVIIAKSENEFDLKKMESAIK